jgi:hypothetical protein
MAAPVVAMAVSESPPACSTQVGWAVPVTLVSQREAVSHRRSEPK